jgi:hypothetical protein
MPDLYSGQILVGDEALSVTVYLTETLDEASGLVSSFGGLDLPTGHSLEPGAVHRLELDDGRAGKVLITRLATPTQAWFRGTGPIE